MLSEIPMINSLQELTALDKSVDQIILVYNQEKKDLIEKMKTNELNFQLINMRTNTFKKLNLTSK